MLYIYLTITLLLLTVTQFYLLFAIRKPDTVTEYLQLKKGSKLPIYIFGTVTILLFFILYLFLKDLSSPQPRDTSFAVPTQTQQPSSLVQELRVETYPGIQNLYFLYRGSDLSENTLHNLALDVRKTDCAVRCTINLYDNKEAYILDQQRPGITDSNKMIQWNLAHYIFVADHYLGYLSNEQYPTFSYYPYKDKYYQKLQQSK